MKASQWESVAGRWQAALRRNRAAGRRFDATPVPNILKGENAGMDFCWVTGRIAVGGGIWNAENMALLARANVTHIVDMQIEFDDTELARPFGIEVLWNGIDDDFQPKPPEVFERGVAFAQEALDGGDSKLLIHCAAGVHRAPMMTLALLCSQGKTLREAMELIQSKRPAADFAEVYLRSVERFLELRVEAEK